MGIGPPAAQDGSQKAQQTAQEGARQRHAHDAKKRACRFLEKSPIRGHHGPGDVKEPAAPLFQQFQVETCLGQGDGRHPQHQDPDRSFFHDSLLYSCLSLSSVQASGGPWNKIRP